MKKIIAISLYGTSRRYCFGAEENARLWKDVFPEWTLRFYVGPEVPQDCVNKLKNYGCEIVIMHKFIQNGLPNTNSAVEGMFWRFLPVSEPELECMLSRDADSRLNVRERAAVDAWLASGKLGHVIRDHWIHGAAVNNGCFMMGGLWGIRGGVIKDIEEKIKQFKPTGQYSNDQTFINFYIWPLIKDSVMEHGERGLPFPPHPPYKGFCGEAFVDV